MSLASNNTKEPADSGGLSTGAIVGIAVGGLILLVIALVVGYVLYRRLKARRRNHGEYRPQAEESRYAKDLPHIPPPNIEGLI